jgi:hypothetical protein
MIHRVCVLPLRLGMRPAIYVTAFCVLLSVGVSEALWRYSKVPSTPNEDLARHLAGVINFKAALDEGQWIPRLQPYPRDSPDAPTFQYYGFLASAAPQPFLYSGFTVLHALILGIAAIRCVGFLALYMTGRLFGASRPSSLLAVLLYAMTPYCLSEFYGRYAVPETAAAAVLPLTLLGWTWITTGRRALGIAVAALSVVLLSLAHPIFLLYGVATLISTGLFAKTWMDRTAIVASVALGLAAASFQWYPAFITRDSLATFPHFDSPFLLRHLSSAWGLIGVTVPMGPTEGYRDYYFTLGAWTIPVLVALFALACGRQRDRRALALGTMLAGVLLLAYSPIDFWQYLPRVLWTVQFPYRLLAFCGLFAALGSALVAPRLSALTALVVGGVVVLMQLPILRGPHLDRALEFSDEEIASIFASRDYTVAETNRTSVSGVGFDGWLVQTNGLRIDPSRTPIDLLLAGRCISSEPLQVWIADPMTGERVSDVQTLHSPFQTRLSIRRLSASRLLTVAVSRYVIPHDNDPRSSDMRALSLNLTRMEFLSPGEVAPDLIPPASVSRTRTGPYTRRFVVDPEQFKSIGRIYDVELPMIYSPLVEVNQGGVPLPIEPSVARRVIVRTHAITRLIDAVYRPPIASGIATAVGAAAILIALVADAVSRRSSPV